jgi:LemA protein
MGTIITIAAVVVIAIYLVVVYNRLVSLRQYTKEAFSNIDVQLKQRADLVPNLVNTVKAYAKHEAETLDNVVKARAATQNATGSAAAAAADGLMSAALGKLFAVAEAYPDLKANQNFIELQREISDIENKIAASRRFLNTSVAEYNASIDQFPAVIVSRRLGFAPEAMFTVTAEARAELERAPVVSF